MLQATDYYPSREKRSEGMIARQEPVLYTRGAQRNDGPLNSSQLNQYARDGFLALDGFFSERAVAPFFDELAAMEQDPKLCARDEVIMDQNQEKIRSVFSMHELSPAFDRLTRDPRLLDMMQQILGSDVYIHQSRINDKAGFCGGGFEWHSDFETWHSEDGMPGMRAISVSIMLTDNNPFNGPLMLVPGSHRHFVACPGETPEQNWTQSLKQQTTGLPPREAIAQLAGHEGIEAPVGPAGSLLLFESNTLHASNANMSPWPRSNLFFVYNSVENRLVQPFSGAEPRPEYLAARKKNHALKRDT